MHRGEMARDYYEILGVYQDADGATIRSAFRARARELHPDVSTAPDAEERFRELSEAYSVLSRSGSRLLYDRFGYRGRGHGGFMPFGRQARRRAESEGREAATGSPVVEVGFFEAARGTSRTVRIAIPVDCATCGGAGELTAAARCPICEGSGRLSRTPRVDFGRLLQIEACHRCNGRGTIAQACARCGGEGRSWLEQWAVVAVPAGTQDGARVETDGDADVIVRVLPPPPDARVIRYTAAAGLLVAIALLVVVLLT